MASFRDAFRQGREQARAARGAPPLSGNQEEAPGFGAATDGSRNRQIRPHSRKPCASATTSWPKRSSFLPR